MNLRLMRIVVGAVALQLATVACADAADAGDPRATQLRALSSRLKYQSGVISLGDGLATLNLSDSFRYLDPAGTDTLLTGIWGNPSTGSKPLGMIVPTDFDPFGDGSWAVVIQFSDDGYVDDDDAGEINYVELLKEMQEAVRGENQQRVKDGYSSIDLVGWAAEPRYDSKEHKFYWAQELKFGESPGENTLNYNLRILGRRGVLVLNAVASMSQLHEIERATPELLRMVEYTDGNRYADYKPGTDKLASYGLAALVAGGVAAKTGIFKGLLVALLAMKKFLIIGVIAALGAVRNLLSRRKQGRDGGTA